MTCSAAMRAEIDVCLIRSARGAKLEVDELARKVAQSRP
jgi:hypothetical protein